MLITGMHLEETPELGNQISLSFDEKVNLFIGPNASGKSTILRSIKSLLTEGQGNNSVRGQDGSFLSMGEIYALVGRVPFVYIPSTRANLHINNFYKLFPDLPNINVGRGGPTSISEVIKAQESVQNRIDQLSVNDFEIFIGESAEIEIDWLRKIYTDRDSYERKQITMALNMSYLCAKAICPEILQGDTPSFISNSWTEKNYLVPDEEDEYGDEIMYFESMGYKIEMEHVDGFDTRSFIREKHTRRGIGAKITGNPTDKPLYLGVLSSGTQGTFLWILSLVLRMLRHNRFSEGWEKKPAILLIDEIENHLHPTWQRRVIPALLEHFPGLQIFATTHSPFVVAGLKAGQVHLLNRDENGRVTATTNTEDVIGWTADEILRTMMGVDDPTDAATAAAARELRQLRQEPPRDDPADEERRQQRIAELRQKVDRDLLAGGPMAAQRELFEQQFANVMKRYRQNQELNQENG